jgi:hypothetical protein
MESRYSKWEEVRISEKGNVGKGCWKSVVIYGEGPMKSRCGSHCAYDGRRVRLAMLDEGTVTLAALGTTLHVTITAIRLVSSKSA